MTAKLNLPRDLAVDRLPSILEVIGVRPAVHLAVELRIDDRAGVLVERVGVVANPGAGEESAGGLVRLQHGVAAVLIVAAVVAENQHHR